MTTTLVTTKQKDLYKKLVEDFLKNEKIDAPIEEKTRFMEICAVEQLNPWKKEIYPVPRKSKLPNGTWITLLTAVIDYKVFMARAEKT
jgi:hypothetical protein